MRGLFLSALLLIGLTLTAGAKTIEDRVLAELRAQGYVILEQGYTFLGRLRIVAENGEIHRELVVNPGTGEVLRDYAILIANMAPKTPATLGHGSGSSTRTSSTGQTSPDEPSTAGAVAGGGTDQSRRH